MAEQDSKGENKEVFKESDRIYRTTELGKGVKKEQFVPRGHMGPAGFDPKEDEGVKQEPVKKPGGKLLSRRTLLKLGGAAAVLTAAGAADQLINKGQGRKGIESGGTAVIKGIFGGTEIAKERTTSSAKPLTESQDAAAKNAALKKTIADQEEENRIAAENAALEKKATAIAPLPTSTPSDADRIAGLKKDIADLKKKKADQAEIAKLEKELSDLVNPPPTPDVAAERARIDKAVAKELADRIAADQPGAKGEVAVPSQAKDIQKEVEKALAAERIRLAEEERRRIEGGVSPLLVGGGVLAAATVVATRRSNRFRNFLANKIPDAIKTKTPNFVKRIFGGGTAAAPAAGPAEAEGVARIAGEPPLDEGVELLTDEDGGGMLPVGTGGVQETAPRVEGEEGEEREPMAVTDVEFKPPPPEVDAGGAAGTAAGAGAEPTPAPQAPNVMEPTDEWQDIPEGWSVPAGDFDNRLTFGGGRQTRKHPKSKLNETPGEAAVDKKPPLEEEEPPIVA